MHNCLIWFLQCFLIDVNTKGVCKQSYIELLETFKDMGCYFVESLTNFM